MCGILNIINKNKKPLDLALCRRAMAKIHNRGPDKRLYYQPENHIFLGQTVLSLVGNVADKTEEYLWSPSKKYYISFNGEIYNYQEVSQKHLSRDISTDRVITDTEVLISLHDALSPEEVPHHLDGMYAYTTLDTEKNKIYISRDIQGEKSLYIYEDNELIIISSQIDAIRSIVPKLDLDTDVLKDYFYTRHFLQQTRTTFKNIRQVDTGELLELDLSTMAFKKIHQLTVRALVSEKRMSEMEQLSLDELTEQLDSVLEKSVKEMIPLDRKYASVLSGGIDSSLLSAYACKYNRPDVLVAVNHVGKDEISLNLEGFEKTLNQKVETLNVNQQIYASEINRSVSTLCSPLLSHSFIGQNIQSAYVRMQGCKALFGGEGADELFGGYSCYLDSQNDSDTCPSLYSGYFEPQLKLFAHNPEELKNELSKGWKESLEAYSFVKDEKTRTLHAQMLCDFALQVSNVAMRGADLMSLLWSIETRSIFVRKPIVEFALNLPMRAKLAPDDSNPEMRTKHILKKVFLKHFPQELIVKKQGFSGFPNESISLLGELEDFISLDLLGIDKKNLNEIKKHRDLEWKLINTEHFLRSIS